MSNAAAKPHPKGETPDEAIERIAPTPASFTLNLSGTGDQPDIEGLSAAFGTFVLMLREAGFNVTGTLTGNKPASHDAVGQLIEAVVIHEHAADVVLPDED